MILPSQLPVLPMQIHKITRTFHLTEQHSSNPAHLPRSFLGDAALAEYVYLAFELGVCSGMKQKKKIPVLLKKWINRYSSTHRNQQRIYMKSTTPSTTRFNAFKHHMATLVSTAVLSCALQALSALMAASKCVANLQIQLLLRCALLFLVWTYRLVQVKDEKLAVQKYEELMEESGGDAAFKASLRKCFITGWVSGIFIEVITWNLC